MRLFKKNYKINILKKCFTFLCYLRFLDCATTYFNFFIRFLGKQTKFVFIEAQKKIFVKFDFKFVTWESKSSKMTIVIKLRFLHLLKKQATIKYRLNKKLLHRKNL